MNPVPSPMLDTKLLDALVGQIAVIDHRGRIVATNRGWRETAESGRLARRDWDYLDECDAAAGRGCEEAAEVGEGIRAVLAGEKEQFSAVYPCPFNRASHWFKVTASRPGDPGMAIVMPTDVTELQIDPLTGLPNRAYFESSLANALGEALRSGGAAFGIALVDVNGFKGINDSFGHAVGDAVLREFASTLRQAFRKQDIVARIGGDEFGVVLGLGASPGTADWLRGRVEAVLGGGHQAPMPNLSASIGVANCPVDGRTADELMRVADMRMYGAKRRSA